MGFRFRKRIGLFGGLAHINLSGGGVSVSAGPNGTNVNVDLMGRRKPRATLGIPGSGLSYQATLKGEQTQREFIENATTEQAQPDPQENLPVPVRREFWPELRRELWLQLKRDFWPMVWRGFLLGLAVGLSRAFNRR